MKPETTAEFRARLAKMIRERETGKKYSVIGASRPHRCAIRSNFIAGDKKYPRLTVCGYCGSPNEIVNQCGCDPDNLPTKIPVDDISSSANMKRGKKNYE